ncbi:sensor histidine kinase [Trichococcus collinsii]|uniref:histidine kinase n=1 Tax=Trichococcus collinsii TaxID=157076 RepID=A0AB37ZYE9_9LACT|nr:sensor histidine kinase [Trichococcus collinsii]CZQ81520.1 histidine kinase [Trichococcus collinsii]SDZ89754.1 Histidine kinase-, DNA gyrase B-, and HSP90-like ATPase [Trichococcus collinsii]
MTDPKERIPQFLLQPTWLMDADYNVVEKNAQAEKFEKDYVVLMEYAVQVARGTCCAFHTDKTACKNCPLENKWAASDGFPITFMGRDGVSYEFFGKLVKREHHWILEIRYIDKPFELEGKSMLTYLNEARESEQKRIARELHDGIAQSIYSLMLETRGLKWTPVEDHQQKLQAIDRHFADVLLEIKSLATELRPSILDDVGLIPAINQFVEQTMEMTGFVIHVIVDGERNALTGRGNVVIYRSIQEAISNALKYSGVNEASLTLDFGQEELRVTIADEGKGFIYDPYHLGFGLLNLRERAHSVGGKMEVDTGIEKGTRITMSVPYKEGLT